MMLSALEKAYARAMEDRGNASREFESSARDLITEQEYWSGFQDGQMTVVKVLREMAAEVK